MNLTCLITNPQPQNDQLADWFVRFGLNVVQLPLHAVVAPSDSGRALRQCVRSLEGIDWLIFSSVNAVDRFTAAMSELNLSIPFGVQIASVGAATASALRAKNIMPSLVATGGGAQSECGAGAFLAQELKDKYNLTGKKVISLQAEEGITAWHAHIISQKADLAVVATHRLEQTVVDVDRFIKSLNSKFPITIIFTAPSAVQRFSELFLKGSKSEIWKNITSYAIGRTTASAIQDVGLNCAGIPEEPSFKNLAQLVAEAKQEANCKKEVDL